MRLVIVVAIRTNVLFPFFQLQNITQNHPDSRPDSHPASHGCFDFGMVSSFWICAVSFVIEKVIDIVNMFAKSSGT